VTLPAAGAANHVGAVGVFLRSVDSLALVSQAEGVALGGNHQPSVDQVIDRSVNDVKVVTQQACKGDRVNLTFGMRRADNFVLNLGELHP